MTQNATVVSSGRTIALISIEKRTIRKLQLRILPFILVLYIVALLDRINIGFAALTMNQELAITTSSDSWSEFSLSAIR